MTFKAAQCPTCGGSLQVPDDHPTVKCMYCGSTIVVREAIQAAAAASIPNLIKLARTAAESLNHQQAYDYFSRVLELDGNSSEAWAGKAEAAGWLSQQTARLPEMIKCFSNAIEVATEDNAGVMRDRAAHVTCQVTTHTYNTMRAGLSPVFAEDHWWNLYLTCLGNLIRTLESAHKLSPDSTNIPKTIQYLCDSNPEKISYIYRVTGQKHWRTLPPDWNNSIREKKRIYSEVLYSLDPSARPPEATSTTTEHVLTRGVWISLAVGLLVVLIFIAALVMVNQNNSGATAQNNPGGKFTGTPQEKVYLEASFRYLNVHYENCKSAAETMAGASNGTSTLSDIRTALLQSRSRMNGSWEADFLPVSNGNIPPKLADIDKKLRRVHMLQELAFGELLQYWSDGSLSHITTGNDKFNNALVECDSTIKNLTKILDSYRPAG